MAEKAMPRPAYSLALPSENIPDAVYAEMVDLIFRPILPSVITGISVLCVGMLIGIRKQDVAIFALTIACVLASLARINLIALYRRRTFSAPVSAAEAKVWERRYAIVSLTIAALIGGINGRGLMMEHSINPMLIPMMTTGLTLSYGAALVSRLAARPIICVGSLLMVMTPTLIGFCARTATAGGSYASAVFTVQTLLIVVFAAVSIESALCIYRTTRAQLVSKFEFAILARQDDLTGVANRAQLRERFNDAVSRFRETDDLLAFHCLDLDYFKAVNDTFGHPIGDFLLQAVTKRLKNIIRDEDTVARLGGDEFAVLQTGIRHVDEARLLALRIIRVLSAAYDIEGHEICIGVSIGIALAPRDGVNLEQIIACADNALYESKHAGRGSALVWRDSALASGVCG